jgi:hypothetical protein
LEKRIAKLKPEKKELLFVLEKFKHFKETSRGSWKLIWNSKNGFIIHQEINVKVNRSKKRTKDEKEIAKLLRENKISFIEQENVIPSNNKAGAAIVDFLVFLDNKIFIIESFCLEKIIPFNKMKSNSEFRKNFIRKFKR